MSGSRIAVVALAIMGALTACGNDRGSTDTSGLAPSVVIGSATAPSALQFSAPSVGGGAIDFTQFAGKPVVLWFWAPT